MASLQKPLLLDIPFDQWNWDEVPKYRREQVRKWVFEKGFLDWDKMSNLPKSLKSDLSELVDLSPMEPVKVQGSS
ncbi:MAG: 23S rRNA (adenine(2503)-C(2))-methyltransferase RlmN, partial [Opitutales bacterium]|nr:23S rRNA (adenine(2503)-C(2))-methyltransferase RlmN [Opitutales bacterium]